jgi:hypothetical protein
MGLVVGRFSAETPKYEILKTTQNYVIRKYAPSLVAEITYDPSMFKGDKDGGFKVLVDYIGIFGKPQNTKTQKISMTSPVITKENKSSSEKIAMTVPVVTNEKNKMVTMQFTLPSMYEKVEEVPKPIDERVVIREEGGKKYGVVTFGGVANDEVVKEKVEKLRLSLEKDGFKVIGDFLVGRYNPPAITIPMFRTNEVLIPVE